MLNWMPFCWTLKMCVSAIFAHSCSVDYEGTRCLCEVVCVGCCLLSIMLLGYCCCWFVVGLLLLVGCCCLLVCCWCLFVCCRCLFPAGLLLLLLVSSTKHTSLKQHANTNPLPCKLTASPRISPKSDSNNKQNKQANNKKNKQANNQQQPNKRNKQTINQTNNQQQPTNERTNQPTNQPTTTITVIKPQQ